MEMKDKLYKTNHKRGFYAFRKCSIFTLAAISLCAFASIPAYMSIEDRVDNKADAQVESSNKVIGYDFEEFNRYGAK